MNALGNALRQDSETYRVPMPWESLKFVQPLRGNLVVVLGSPGVGKSAFALNWSLKHDDPSAIISLDTDLHTQATRAASILSGVSMDRVRRSPRAWASYLERNAKGVRAYDISVTTREILGVLEAEREFWGVSPALTVVDNVSNLVREGDYGEYRKVFVELHRIARAADTCVVALHHVTRGAKFGRPLTLTSGQFAGEQEAEVVLGLWAKEPGIMQVSALKNRSGQADPAGEMYVPLEFNMETMDLRDVRPETYAIQALKGDPL